MSLDTTNVQHEKLVLKLVKPFILDFSVAEEDGDDLDEVVKLEDDVKEKNVSPPKRKMKTEEAGSTKKNKKKNKK